MIQEDKELLLKDLCTRLPYKVIVEFVSYEGEENPWFGELSCKDLDCFMRDVEFVEIKPYLFPLSSMTKEQESYLHFNTKFKLDICNDLTVKNDEDDNYFYTDIYDYSSLIDWCNKNHFDYRGLIEKGLAIDATNLNIY